MHGSTDAGLIPFLEGWGRQHRDNALVMCISLVAGQCTFPEYGSVFAYCGSAAVSSVLLDIHVSKPGALLGGAS